MQWEVVQQKLGRDESVRPRGRYLRVSRDYYYYHTLTTQQDTTLLDKTKHDKTLDDSLCDFRMEGRIPQGRMTANEQEHSINEPQQREMQTMDATEQERLKKAFCSIVVPIVFLVIISLLFFGPFAGLLFFSMVLLFCLCTRRSIMYRRAQEDNEQRHIGHVQGQRGNSPEEQAPNFDALIVRQYAVPTDGTSEAVCDICLDEFQEAELIARSPNTFCIHEFHKECIINALQVNQSCPCCRREYLKVVREDDRENTSADVENQRSTSISILSYLDVVLDIDIHDDERTVESSAATEEEVEERNITQEADPASLTAIVTATFTVVSTSVEEEQAATTEPTSFNGGATRPDAVMEEST